MGELRDGARMLTGKDGMDRLINPVTFKDLVEADLRRAGRLIIEIQDEIDPQFRIATPGGDYWIAAQLPPYETERRIILGHLATYMAWKQALAFTLACELVILDCVWCCGIARAERHACLSRVAREPRPWTVKNFETVEWLPVATIDPVIAGLLPMRPRAMTPKEISGLQKWFGAEGKFPAVHIGSGEVRGV